jgi:phosphoadenosine phosphosulfate reductase
LTALSQTVEPARYSFKQVAELATRFDGAAASELLEWGLETFGSRLVLASSFSLEDIVLIDLAAQIDPGVRVFTLDTGRLPEETHVAMNAVREHFGIDLEVMFPDRDSVERLVSTKGPTSFRESVENRKECCQIRKVEPLRRALASADAWATGMRRDQSVTRQGLRAVELDMLNGGLLKLNPLAEWTSAQTRRHVADRGLPYNALVDLGYQSIGCAPCTRAVNPGEDERAGRWWWEKPDDKECGLHA